MKRTRIISVLLCGILTFTALLSSCADGKVSLRESGGACVSEKGGTDYRHASTCYIAASLGDAYGELTVSSKHSVGLFTIPGLDPEEWLVTEEGDVLYAEDVTLPSLSDMAPTEVYVYTNASTPSKSAEILDKATVDQLTAACAPDRGVKGTPQAAANYTVRFKSPAYPGLYYTLRYVEHGGEYFLYDPFDGVTYTVSRAIRDAVDAAVTTETQAETEGAAL